MIRVDDFAGAPGDDITFVVDGSAYSIVPERPTQLLGWYAAGNWPMLATLTRPEDLWSRLYDPSDCFDLRDLFGITSNVWSRYAGLPWWQACNLSAGLVSGWPDVVGMSVEHGFDPERASIRRTLAWYRHVVLSNCKDANDRKARIAELSRVPREFAAVLPKTRQEIQAGSDSFKQLSAMLGSLR